MTSTHKSVRGNLVALVLATIGLFTAQGDSFITTNVRFEDFYLTPEAGTVEFLTPADDLSSSSTVVIPSNSVILPGGDSLVIPGESEDFTRIIRLIIHPPVPEMIGQPLDVQWGFKSSGTFDYFFDTMPYVILAHAVGEIGVFGPVNAGDMQSSFNAVLQHQNLNPRYFREFHEVRNFSIPEYAHYAFRFGQEYQFNIWISTVAHGNLVRTDDSSVGIVPVGVCLGILAVAKRKVIRRKNALR